MPKRSRLPGPERGRRVLGTLEPPKDPYTELWLTQFRLAHERLEVLLANKETQASDEIPALTRTLNELSRNLTVNEITGTPQQQGILISAFQSAVTTIGKIPSPTERIDRFRENIQARIGDLEAEQQMHERSPHTENYF